MKTLFLLLFPFCLQAQKTDTLDFRDTMWILGRDGIPQKTDTVKVLLLVSDSAWTRGAVYQEHGYWVRLRNPCYDMPCVVYGWDKPNNSEWIHIQYLTFSKKPIPKNIIVWQIKTL